VLITPIGEEVLKEAREILQKVEELEHLAATRKGVFNFPLTLGVIPTIAPFLLPRLFPHLHAQHPHAQLNIVEEQSHVLVDMMRSGELDTAILALPFPCDGLMCFEFWQEDFYWVVPKAHESAQLDEIHSDHIPQDSLMLLKDGHCLKDHALDACRFSEQKANHGFGATSLTTLIQMVMGNLGTTLVPAMALEQLVHQSDKLAAIHLNEPGPHRRIACLIRPNYTRMPTVEALMNICKTALQTNISDCQ
jgi:LysR family hydrogen peroxide-inducible transcriptional activator